VIYTVEEALTVGQPDEVWDRWTSEMKPVSDLLAVPGFNTAQRFKGLALDPSPSLALYSIDSADVLQSRPYLDGAGGGKLGTPKWGKHLSFWHRNLFTGLDRAPAVPEDSRLLVIDSREPDVVIDGLSITWLSVVGLDRTTPCRGLAIIDKAVADSYLSTPLAHVRVFAPRMAQAVSSRA